MAKLYLNGWWKWVALAMCSVVMVIATSVAGYAMKKQGATEERTTGLEIRAAVVETKLDSVIETQKEHGRILARIAADVREQP